MYVYASVGVMAHRFIDVLGVTFTVTAIPSWIPRTCMLDFFIGNALAVSGFSA